MNFTNSVSLLFNNLCPTRYRANYNYDPLREGKAPVAQAFAYAWPEQETDDQKNDLKKEYSEKLEKSTVTFPSLPEVLKKASGSGYVITEIVGLGMGSLDQILVPGLTNVPESHRRKELENNEKEADETMSRNLAEFKLAITVKSALSTLQGKESDGKKASRYRANLSSLRKKQGRKQQGRHYIYKTRVIHQSMKTS